MAGVPLCFLWLCHSAYGILVPPPWIKLLTPALEAQSPNYRTIREIPGAPTYITDEVWATAPPNTAAQVEVQCRPSGPG